MKVADRNYVSVWFWVFALMVMSIPAVNVVLEHYGPPDA